MIIEIVMSHKKTYFWSKKITFFLIEYSSAVEYSRLRGAVAVAAAVAVAVAVRILNRNDNYSIWNVILEWRYAITHLIKDYE